MIVYIASLPHSGSTLLSLLLARHPHVVALGEVRLQTEKIRRDAAAAGEGTCGCGARIRECPIWEPFIAHHVAGAAPVDDLRLVERLVRETHGPDAVMVDASKIREPVDELAADRGTSVRIVHLSRDYRSWIVSAADLRRRKGKPLAWWSGLQSARRWVRENRKLERSIAASGFPSMLLGYEELVLAPLLAWPALWEFLGLPAATVPHDVAGARNHIFSGNRMRESEEKRVVSYDRRWLSRDDWRLASRLLPGLSSFNRRWAYSHGIAGRGDRNEIETLSK
jgi:hypothetical protein